MRMVQAQIFTVMILNINYDAVPQNAAASLLTMRVVTLWIITVMISVMMLILVMMLALKLLL